MADAPRGLPLLSGPPPDLPLDDRVESSCRKCNKEFNILFARGRRCNHCGYLYCNTCSDYQALMPRRGDDAGYDCMPVCAFCVQYLQITAGGKGFLRSQPLSKLKNYMQAYGIRLGVGVIEKDDIINAIVDARTESGCLPKRNENYYRLHAVPNGQTGRPRGLFSRPERTPQPQQHLDPRTGWTRTGDFNRPDLESDPAEGIQLDATNHGNAAHHQQQGRDTRPQYAPPPGPPPYATYNSSRRNASSPNVANTQPQLQNTSSAPHGSQRSGGTPQTYPPSDTNRQANPGPTTRPATAPPPQPRPPRPHAPTLDELLNMQEEEISALSIRILKDILSNNHVRPGPVLEKTELVMRVNDLITAERRERVHMEAVRERESWEAQEREWAARERERAAREAREAERRGRAEEEARERRRDHYRTTVENASESGESGEGNSADGHTPPELPQTGSSSPTPRSEAEKGEDAAPAERSRSPSPPSRLPPERSGLCVVCQDEEANIVVIDCGHLALCRACSDLVWSSTRECPLCRTRIVTKARLLRVFKT